MSLAIVLYIFPKALVARFMKLRHCEPNMELDIDAQNCEVNVDNDQHTVALRDTNMDYQFRPLELSNYPLYIFLVATSVVPKKYAIDVVWPFVSNDGNWSREIDNLPAAHGLQKTHVVELHTKRPWKVPCFVGGMLPDQEKDAVTHALGMLTLFKP